MTLSIWLSPEARRFMDLPVVGWADESAVARLMPFTSVWTAPLAKSPWLFASFPVVKKKAPRLTSANAPSGFHWDARFVFPLYSTAADRLEKSGDVVPIDDDFHALPPIHTLLKGAASKGGLVPVHLRAMLTEIGTLELWCVSETHPERWRLEFELREK
jgi:hypothetical protein